MQNYNFLSYLARKEKTIKNIVTLNRAKNLNTQTYGLQILHFVQNDMSMIGAHLHLV